MFPSAALSNSTSMSEEGSASSGTRALDSNILTYVFPLTSHNHHHHQQSQPKTKKKRNQPGNPDPDAEVIALSPKTLMATNRFVCEICNKGFQRDQNLQLHRRGHNLPWKLRQRSSKEVVRKKVYVCPEPSCVHHHPSRALGDLTGIKKHFSRKHGEKKWKCDKCSKRYAVQSDWKAHVKTCGTREYRCDCGTLFSRKDSFITHRAFCDALAEETAKLIANSTSTTSTINPPPLHHQHHPLFLPFSSSWDPSLTNPNPNPNLNPNPNPHQFNYQGYPPLQLPATISSPPLSATALLQRATSMGPITTTNVAHRSTWHNSDRLTRDFLGAPAGDEAGEVEEMLPLTCLDLVTSLRCPGTATRHFSRFPAVTGTWGDC